jgi:hypothetical protein
VTLAAAKAERRRIPEGAIRARGRELVAALELLEERARDGAAAAELAGELERLDELRRSGEAWRRRRLALEWCAVEGAAVVTVEACSSCGHRRDRAPRGCGKRVCPRCVVRQRIRLRRALAGAIRSMRRPRFVTLTVKSRPRLSEALESLWSSWARLRARRWWRARVRRAVVVLEVTRSEAGWHPHLHLVAEGAFLPWSRREAYLSAHPEERGAWPSRGRASSAVWSSRFFGRAASPADGCEARRRTVARELRRLRARAGSLEAAELERGRELAGELARLSRCCEEHQSGLVEEWERASRGAGARWGVSVKAVNERTAGELAKYLAKFLHPEAASCGTAELSEFLEETLGARSLRAYGGLRLELEAEAPPPALEPCECGGGPWVYLETRLVLLDREERAP